MTKAIIFDLDGVIVHTDHFHYLAWKRLADRLGIYFDETINHRLRGVSRMDSLAIILERSTVQYGDEEKASFAAEKNEVYRSLLAGMSPADVSDEVRNTLTALKARGFLLAIGSSSKNTPLILEKTDLVRYFDAVSDGNNITKSKPDPEVFVKAAEMLGVPCEACYVVEDADAGIRAGIAGGMTTIAIGEAAKSGIAHHDVSRFSEIADVVEA